MFVTQSKYELLQQENEQLKSFNEKLNESNLANSQETAIILQLCKENLHRLMDEEVRLKTALTAAENAFRTEAEKAAHLQRVVAEMHREIESLAAPAAPASDEPLSDVAALQVRRAQIEDELKIVENTPSVVRADFTRRRVQMQNLKTEKEKVTNDLNRLENAKTVVVPAEQI